MKRFDAKQSEVVLKHLRQKLREPLPGPRAQLRMAPVGRSLTPPDGVTPRQAAVLLILAPRC